MTITVMLKKETIKLKQFCTNEHFPQHCKFSLKKTVTKVKEVSKLNLETSNSKLLLQDKKYHLIILTIHKKYNW